MPANAWEYGVIGNATGAAIRVYIGFGRNGLDALAQRQRGRHAVRAWPTIVLIDKKGIIRYSHFGEGAYEQTQSMIAKLLAGAA